VGKSSKTSIISRLSNDTEAGINNVSIIHARCGVTLPLPNSIM